MTDQQRIQQITELLKQQWCVDGVVRCLGTSYTVIKNPATGFQTLTFELRDSIRGVFIVSISPDNDNIIKP